LRELRESLAKGDKTATEPVFRSTVSALDKAVQKGVLHNNTASRYKSRLSARLNALK
jgi:small subunit ribosomal protein S20